MGLVIFSEAVAASLAEDLKQSHEEVDYVQIEIQCHANRVDGAFELKVRHMPVVAYVQGEDRRDDIIEDAQMRS